MGEVGCEFAATMNEGDQTFGEYVARAYDATLPASKPGDILTTEPDGTVWLCRLDGTPVLAMSAEAAERLRGRYTP